MLAQAKQKLSGIQEVLGGMNVDGDTITKYKTWEEIPDYLKTKTALGREGKKPGNAPVGRIFQYASTRWIMLYDEREAIPKRKISDEQRAQLARNRELARERRTCSDCGKYYRQPIEHPDRLCNECVRFQEERAYWDNVSKKANEMFQDWHANRNWLVLDTETTGVCSTDEIVEIAVLNSSGDVLIESLVRPKQPIPPDATAIHGISNSNVKDAPTWSEIIERLRCILEGKTVLIYNANFDIQMIKQTCEKWNCVMPNFKSECVMRVYSELNSVEYYYSLSEATKEYGQSHRAADDCRLVLHLIAQIGGE